MRNETGIIVRICSLESVIRCYILFHSVSFCFIRCHWLFCKQEKIYVGVCPYLLRANFHIFLPLTDFARTNVPIFCPCRILSGQFFWIFVFVGFCPGKIFALVGACRCPPLFARLISHSSLSNDI